MKISVAIATFNGEKFIKQQLTSILNQTKAVDEVIICDDASTDNTAKICRLFIEENRLDSWKLYVNDKNVGYCYNFYNAIEKCSGDVIFLCDQDDLWYPQRVEKMCCQLNLAPEIWVLSCRYDVIDENSDIIDLKIPYLVSNFDDSIEFLTQESFIGCSYIRGFSMCFRKEIKDKLKPIDLKSLLSHDWYICMLGFNFGKVAVLNSKLCGYRYHGNNISLSDITRSTFLGDRKKRIRGLYESVEGHTYIASLTENESIKSEIIKFSEFEKKRIKFLEDKNFWKWLALFSELNQYNRYYKGNGIRVLLGDFAYCYNINFKKKKTN